MTAPTRRRWYGWSYTFRSSRGVLVEIDNLYRRWEIGQVLPLSNYSNQPTCETYTVLKRWPSERPEWKADE